MNTQRLPATLLVLGAACIASPATADLNSELQVPPLAPEQRTLDDIHLWNGQVIIETVGDGARFNVVSLETGSVTPLKCPGGARVFDLTESASGSFALCKGSLGLRLFSVDEDRWSKMGLPKRFAENKWHRICASSSTIFLLGKRTIYFRSVERGPWSKVRFIPANEEFRKTFPFAQHLLATEDALYLGWDWGEWGGGLQKIRIVDHDGGKDFETVGTLTGEPVRGIVAKPDGTVWVATGLAHLSGREAGLLQDDDSGTTELISQSNYRGSSGSFSLPGDTDISGLALGPRGFPYVAATALGVFEVSNSGLAEVLRADLRIRYTLRELGSTIGVGSSPQGMVVPDEGTIVLATRSTGVLVFRRQIDGFDVRQILVPGDNP